MNGAPLWLEGNGQPMTDPPKTVTAEHWPQPQPLPDGLPPVARFDLALLPHTLRPWIADICERTQCPPDFVAVSVMAALGSVLGRKVGIRPQALTDWTVVPNQWALIVGRPGAMKSPAIEAAIAPVKALADGKEKGAAKGKDQPFVFSPGDLSLPDCGSPRYEWKFDDGTTSTSAVVSHAFANVGVHTATLKVRCGACDRVLAQDDVQVKVVKIEIRVKDGATQSHVTGAENWAAVRKANETVQIEAILTPDDPDLARDIQWSGATADAANPKLAKVSKGASTRHQVQASVVGETSNQVSVWILWVELEFRTSGTMSPTNSATQLTDHGFPNLGPMTDETHFAQGFTVGEASGNIEIVGHLQPAGVNAVVGAGWELRREVRSFWCSNGVIDNSHQHDDTSSSHFKDLTPQSDDQIYDIDGPTAGNDFNVIRTREVYDAFRQWAEWNGEKASDTKTWHYFAQIDDDLDAANKPRNVDTVLNDLGQGLSIPPSRCHFAPRN